MDVPFVQDAVDPAIFGPQLFWDAAHFNEEGSRVMARMMAAWVCARPKLTHGKDCRDGPAP
jgi:lysophospholipase L1-like esterase